MSALHKIVHLFFASRIRKQIRAQTGISLNTFRFAYGNIKPDLTFSMCTTPHTLSCSQSVLQAHVVKLFQESLHIAKFSENLGVVMHYLCDYFCFAHSEVFTGGLLAHVIYELRMIANVFKPPADNVPPRQTSRYARQSCCSANSLTRYSIQQYKIHLASNPSTLADMNKAIEVSQVFCLEAVERWCSLCFETLEDVYDWEDAQSAIPTAYT